MNVTLSSWRPASVITLGDALKTLNRPLTGLCYGPNRCFFVRWQDGTPEFPSEEAKGEWPRVYEARFFDEDGELRWQRSLDGSGEGVAVYLSEANSQGPTDWKAMTPRTELSPLPGGYLIRGERLDADGLPPGWYCVSSAAVGKLSVPFDLGACSAKVKRVSLVVREYIGPAPGPAGEDGNRAVVEKRWIKLEYVEEPS